MSSPADTTADFLAAAGIGVVASGLDWSIHIGSEPTEPKKTVTVYDTVGSDPVLSEIDLRRPSVQVRVKSDEYAAGWGKANDVHVALVEAGKTIHASTVTIGWFGQGDVLFIGRDDENNYLFTCNFEMMRQSL